MKSTINITLYLLFISLFFFEGYLGAGIFNQGLHLIPTKLSWLPEILSFFIVIYISIILALNKKVYIPSKYLHFFIFVGLYLLAGIIINRVPSGAIFAGVRRYFIFLPLFFLPTVYKFSEKEIRWHLLFITALCIIQLPFAIYQRISMPPYLSDGDLIIGTLSSSTNLTLIQVCCMSFLCAFYMRKRIKLYQLLVLSIIIFIPTAINETKATVILFPVAVIVPIIYGSPNIINFKKISLILLSCVLFTAVFVPIYTYFYKTNIYEFFSPNSDDRGVDSAEGYLYKGMNVHNIYEEPGRIDALVFSFKILKRHPSNLLIGLGIGNVNESGIKGFRGNYVEYDKYGANASSATSLIWETGLFGLFLYAIFFFYVLLDAIKIKFENNIFGTIAIGWIAVIFILYLCFFYTNIFHQKLIGFLFYYFSGLIASHYAELTKNTTNRIQPA